MKIIWIALFLLFALDAQAQKGTTTLSASYGIGNGTIRPIVGVAKMAGSYTKGDVDVLGINYNFGFKKHKSFETGFLFLRHNYTYTEFGFPGAISVTDKTNTSLLIPAKLRFNILKYFFISGGFLADINLANGDGHSLGLGVGAGLQYYHKNKYGIFIYPQANLHTLGIGLAESHVSFGLSYRLVKK